MPASFAFPDGSAVDLYSPLVFTLASSPIADGTHSPSSAG
jgi:hypothetical protein